jgi:hypothetical protein
MSVNDRVRYSATYLAINAPHVRCRCPDIRGRVSRLHEGLIWVEWEDGFHGAPLTEAMLTVMS